MAAGDAWDQPLDDWELRALEQQLEELAVPDGDAAEVLARLAEAIFPGRVGLGDADRVAWPEPQHRTAVDHGAAPADPRELLEAQIRQSEVRFRSLVEQLPAVVFYAALGDGENEVYVSPQIETLLGFTQEEWLTNPLLWYSQMHPDDHQTVIQAFTKGVQTGAPFRAQVRFFSRTGEEVWILGEARLIRDEAQRPAYFQGVAFDITITKRAQEVIAQVERARAESAQLRAEAFAAHNLRLRQLNKELRAAKEAAEAAAHARSNFLTTMSHELRTPLNSVIVLASLLANESLTPAQQDMVRHMQLASDHLLALINDVLEFSRLRAGQVELDERSFNLLDWLDETLDIVAPRAAEKGLALRLVVATAVPQRLRADQGRLRQILLNLLGNAVKFTASGFIEVRIGGEQLEDGRWEFECAVRDSGPGVKPQDAAVLFDEFRQADSGIAREFGGTGLGLAICKHLCQLLGGRIWFEAPTAPGATVAFTWVADADDAEVTAPLVRPAGTGVVADPVPAAGRPHRAAVGSTLRILVAEDNQMNQQVALLLLAAMGHDADVVGDGDDAVAAVRAEDYDVVLMDVAMPGTDGLSATRAIRALGTAVHQPRIVALTAHAFPGDSEMCLEAGMDDYVTKPIDRRLLARALEAQVAPSAEGGHRPVPDPGRDHVRVVAGQAPGGVALLSAAPPIRASAAGGGGNAGEDFDPSFAREIMASFGREPFSNLVTIFRTEGTRLLGDAASAVAVDDPSAAETASHTLKSGAANLGARGLYDNCARLEAMARSGSVRGAGPLVAAMDAQLAEALRYLDDILAAP